MDMFIQSLVNGVTGSLILILIASGLCLIFGIMHIVNFAHGEFFMLGGFGAWLFFVRYPLPFIESDHLRYIFSVMLSMTFVGLLGGQKGQANNAVWHILT
jgi:branched-chain amino acid transport system permease protein